MPPYPPQARRTTAPLAFLSAVSKAIPTSRARSRSSPPGYRDVSRSPHRRGYQGDISALGHGLLPHDDDVALVDAGLDHAVAVDLEGETAPPRGDPTFRPHLADDILLGEEGLPGGHPSVDTSPACACLHLSACTAQAGADSFVMGSLTVAEMPYLEK